MVFLLIGTLADPPKEVGKVVVLDAWIRFLVVAVTIWLIVGLGEPKIALPIAWKPSRLKVFGAWFIGVAVLGYTLMSMSQAVEEERMKDPAYAAAKQAEEEERAERREERAKQQAQRRIAQLRFSAVQMAHTFMERRLKAPASAEFQSVYEAEVSDLPGDEFEVSTYVDAQNSFGAMIRTRYLAHLRYGADNRWELIELVTDQDIERLLRKALSEQE